MLARIFSDADVNASERDELNAFFASGALDAAATKEVVDGFVATTWKAASADGVITDIEKQRLREIAAVLGLSRTSLPEGWAALVG
jgi:tellurite resistance protein